MKRIGAVILNYNGWRDTIACAQSLVDSQEPFAWIVIVDNASQDESLTCLEAWGRTLPQTLSFARTSSKEQPDIPPAAVLLVAHDVNGGYAAGNNVGIRLLMQWGADAVWILNNDTVVDPCALRAMRERLFSRARPGLCGSLVVYAADNNTVQCRGGGRTNPWTALSVLDGGGLTVEQALRCTADDVEQRINFIYGASVMASREFIATVGLMDERYFLYCEEQDWAYSARGRFDWAYAAGAVVYHKEGGTTGFAAHKMSLRALWRLTRSRLQLTCKHYPLAVPVVCAGIFFAGIRLLWRRGYRLIFQGTVPLT